MKLKERVLLIDLSTVVELFEMTKWKFFEYDGDDNAVKVEVPKGDRETYIVEMQFDDSKKRREAVKALENNGFIQQEIRQKGNF